VILKITASGSSQPLLEAVNRFWKQSTASGSGQLLLEAVNKTTLLRDAD
jgi:hypothetical protein